MKLRSRIADPINLLLTALLCQCASFNALAGPLPCKLLTAARVFDGINFPQDNMSVLIEGNKVKQVGTYAQLKNQCLIRINLGDATILPGFIESHAHIAFQNVRKDKVLEHGITTAQDTGGPLMPPEGSNGALRLLSVGPIIQAEGGYPLNTFTHPSPGGVYDQIGYPISSDSSEDDVKNVVQHLVDGGATAIKIALEPGGEAGAPWMIPHGPSGVPANPGAWPVLSHDQVQWIVAKAHELHKRVIAHVGEQVGFDLAVGTEVGDQAVDELAHMPCAVITEESIQHAVDMGVDFVTTFDTFLSTNDLQGSSCAGIHHNAHTVTHKIAMTPGTESEFIYGSEVAHDNVPWGINGEEMHMMLHLTHGAGDIDFNDVVNVFRAATSRAGENLGIDKLGTLTPGAPADLIAVKGNPFERFKLLEYPDLVMSGGKIVVFKFLP